MSRPWLTSTLAATAAALLLLVLAACAPRVSPGTAMDTPDAAWKSFRRHYCSPSKDPAMKVKASLYYSRIKPRKRTNRTLVTLWGDFDGPMRLDVSASVGTLLAHIREDASGLLAFYPQEDKAYAHTDPVLGATRLGMPFPFSLNELARVSTGDFSGLAPRTYTTAKRVGETYVYEVKGKLVTRIILDTLGRPILMHGPTTITQNGAHSWQLEINRFEDAAANVTPLPGKLTLALDNGEKGILHIKSRELMVASWPAASTNLTLPDSVEPIRLDKGIYTGETGELPVIYEDK
ncbi:hypothetical protein PSDVSF_20640 [Pseudodesulfovibrio sediminis]|uniref:DUF4292 domain-containing protein n=2 Tax=Pseudodesulfovibrio sediminis TaxID=2810563 RepID=A0ABN6ETK1_9BACT|nr:hypothetical protein PSDVSF_20640 [Pseudodesulfovibrio sediminis]